MYGRVHMGISVVGRHGTKEMMQPCPFTCKPSLQCRHLPAPTVKVSPKQWENGGCSIHGAEGSYGKPFDEG